MGVHFRGGVSRVRISQFADDERLNPDVSGVFADMNCFLAVKQILMVKIIGPDPLLDMSNCRGLGLVCPRLQGSSCHAR